MLIPLPAGCDDTQSASPPAAPPVESKSASDADRPTTRQLMDGPRIPLRLLGFGLIVDVPASWRLDTLGEITFLAGPAPLGDIQIQISARNSVTARQIDYIVRGNNKELADHPESVLVAHLDDLGSTKVFEKVTRSDSSTIQQPDVRGNPTTNVSSLDTWSFAVFIRQDDLYEQYAFNVVAPTQEEYDADKDLVRSVIDSIRTDELPPSNP